MPNNSPLVAIVGEPNVGKSTLLNKIVEQRSALTSPVAGTTRDRFYARASWNGVDFSLVDTAGIILEQREELEKNVQKQVDIAIREADLILYVIDGKQSTESLNRQILQKIRKSKKEAILVVNKIDSPKKLAEAESAYRMTGFKEIFPVSALSGMNVGDLLDEVATKLRSKGFAQTEEEGSEVTVTIVGKPNVGKSSLFNQIIGEERVVVSDVAGTTRNAIDTIVEFKGRKIKFMDTAGLKRKEHRAAVPDIYASLQTLREVKKSDICILMIDATEHITKQDQRVAAEVVKASKGLILVANKIDKLDSNEKKQLEEQLPEYFEFLWWAPAVPVSAINGEGVKEILDYILKIFANRNKSIDNQTLSELLYLKLRQRPPQRIRDEREPKVFSLHQIGLNPPVFNLVVNKPSAISMQFRKFLQNSIVRELDFWGTPIRLTLGIKKGNPAVPDMQRKKRQKKRGGAARGSRHRK